MGQTPEKLARMFRLLGSVSRDTPEISGSQTPWSVFRNGNDVKN